MKIARHWVRESVKAIDASGKTHRGEAWGWSATSVEEARGRARESAARVAQWLAQGYQEPAPPPSAQYLYLLDRPPREEIVEERHDDAGDVSALITRNAYGALVLNSRDLMFVDIDFKPPQPSLWSLFRWFFGGKADGPAAEPVPDSEAGTLARVRQWCAEHPDYGVRLYRTASGFRAAIVDRPMRADEDAARAILAELGSDPLYRRLCDAQECFRARLTPKPWRIGMEAPPERFPFADAAAEKRYRVWQRKYDAAVPRFAACRLVETHGPRDVHAALAPLVELHDSLTGSRRELPLA